MAERTRGYAHRIDVRAPVELLCVLGAGAGTAGVLLIGYVATRYVADFFPLVATGPETPAGTGNQSLPG